MFHKDNSLHLLQHLQLHYNCHLVIIPLTNLHLKAYPKQDYVLRNLHLFLKMDRILQI